ncbi:aminotransferase class V-fold PLP-dependent enzyme [Arenimonas sp.]|uniref:aminotransferase class V-fold PLP-dependent enzyme n=1 Tax=Arenimonas sp. TaxID=1872635 RepID=UPI0035B16AD0
MAVTRRQFLATPAALAASALVPGSLLAAVASQTPAMPDLSNWDIVRAQFMLDPAYRHFSSFYIASHPAPVRDALEGYRRALDANPLLTVEHGMFGSDEQHLPSAVARDVAAYFGGRPEDICLVRSTTEGLALVYHGLPLQAGDEVLCTTHDHYAHHESIRLATQRAGATMRKIALHDDAAKASTDEMIARLKAAIGPKTRVVGLTWVHSSSGLRLPIREIAAALGELPQSVLLVVDGVHGLGSADEDIPSTGVDYFVAGTHKWIFAPRGTGIVWSDAAGWARLRPVVPSFTDIESYEAWAGDRDPQTPNNAGRMSPGGFHAFEHQWAMGAAFRMHSTMGRRRVAERIAAMNSQLKEGLAGLPKVRLHTPMSPALSAGVVAFEVEGLTPQQVVQQLLERGFLASVSPYAVAYARLAPSLVNTAEEVDQALAAMRQVAA